MKTLPTEKTLIEELDLLEGKNIQGLHNSKDAEIGFWTLKAKIDLAIFRENEKEKEENV